jgi:hypothetical protein
MKRMTKLTALCFIFFVWQFGYANTPETISPQGFWKTTDDLSGESRAILEISEAADHSFSGRIVKTFPGPDEKQHAVCTLCQDERHNQPIEGLVILKNLHQNKNNLTEWNGGEILDPKTGKLYHFQLQIVDNGQKLKVRGYIGLPLFGRSQIWVKVPDPS